MGHNAWCVQTNWLVVALAMLIAATACDGNDGSSTDAALALSEPSRRDSGSITIIENHSPRWRDVGGWLVDSTPEFAITATLERRAVEFQHLLSVHRLTDGSVVVLDMAPPFVHAFAADGTPLWSAAGRGEGPGEIRAPALLTRIRGDSLVVEDADTPRSLLLTGDGTVVSTLPSRLTHMPDADGVERLLQPAIRLADGSLVGYTPVMRRAELQGSGFVAPRWPTYLMTRDGKQVTALGEWHFVTTAQLMAPSVHVVFGATAALVPTDDGFLYGFPTNDELRLYDEVGQLRTIIRTPGDRRPATSAEADSARVMLARAMSNPLRPPLRTEDLLLDTLPAFGRVVVGTDGVIWRERFDAGAPPAATGVSGGNRGAVWDVHQTNGAWLGAVLTPAHFRLTDAGADWIAGVYADDNDVQTPRVYGLQRR